MSGNDSTAVGGTTNEVIYDERHNGFLLRLELTGDHMECRGSIEVEEQGDLIDSPELLRILRDCEVVEGLLGERIGDFCRDACEGKNQKNVVLAEAHLPERGEDGRVELVVSATRKEASFTESEDGTIDYRTRNQYSNVWPGDRIARIIPPQPGNPGSTVTGEPIPALLGKECTVKPGKEVHLDEDGAYFVTDIAGRVVFEGETISVSEEFKVKGDVDLEVGHINFVGYVEVNGDVLDDFDVKGTKGVKVKGVVGACTVESDGDITIGSAAGKDVGFIRCGGNLKAKYLNAVTVECMGDVTVDYEIRNSVVKSAGAISVTKGTISGGECVALRGIEAKNVGSIAGTVTKLTSGIYFPEVDRLARLRYQQKSFGEQTGNIGDVLGPLRTRIHVEANISETIKLREQILTERLEELGTKIIQVREELENFKKEEHPDEVAKLNIKNRLGESVVLRLVDAEEETRFERDGAMSVTYNPHRGELHYGSMTPLQEPVEHEEEKKAAEG